MFTNYLVQNKYLSQEAALILAKSNEFFVREKLASRDFLTKEVQLILVNDISEVRMCLTKCKFLDEEIQIILSKDKDLRIRKWLSWRCNMCDEARKNIAGTLGIV